MSTRTQMSKELRKAEVQLKQLKETRRIEEARDMLGFEGDPIYFHTKLNFDPLERGKRVTICALIVGEEVWYGYARSHVHDAKVWNKKRGRFIAFERAIEAPIVKIPLPEDHIKHSIIEKAKAIARDLIITDKDATILTEDQVMAKLAKKRDQYDREQKILDKKGLDLIKMTNKVHEFFNPPPVEQPQATAITAEAVN